MWALGFSETEARQLQVEACPDPYRELWKGLRTYCLPPRDEVLEAAGLLRVDGSVEVYANGGMA